MLILNTKSDVNPPNLLCPEHNKALIENSIKASHSIEIYLKSKLADRLKQMTLD